MYFQAGVVGFVGEDEIKPPLLSNVSPAAVPVSKLFPDGAAEESVSTNHGSFRDGLMMDILKDHPGLTYEELDKQMSAFGF